MSLARIDTTPRPLRTEARPAHPHLRAVADPAPRGDDRRREAPRLHAVTGRPEARGFALYIGFDGEHAETDLGGLVEALRRVTAELAPGSDTYAAVGLAPEGAPGRSIDLVRLALQEPGAVAKSRPEPDAPDEDRAASGVVVDVSRKRLLIDNLPVSLTFKEFELLQYLVLREGRTVERAELLTALWNVHEEETPNERTIDVHVRRLRSKLGDYTDIVRTVRGVGYRFDRHADVSIRHASAPSPDRI